MGALRPPNLDAIGFESNDVIPPRQWHFDGMLESTKQWSPFSVLLGVALSDQSLPNCGNLIAFKGSHDILQPMVREESQVPGTHSFLGEDGADIVKPEMRNGE